MELKEYLVEIVAFLKDYLNDSRQKMYVLGVSGGVDSSLTAALLKKAVGVKKMMCLIMPIDSEKEDSCDAVKVCESLNVPYIILDASESFHLLCQNFKEKGISLTRLAKANLKVRLRMCMLYAYAQDNHGLVVGTDNMDERYTGYFTKYGDGAADILPLAHLTKNEVVQAAKLLGLPDFLANRTPSAGLFPGQKDEDELGVSYKTLDAYLLGEKVDEKSKARIEYLHAISEHKRTLIPSPKPFIRGK